MSSSTSNDNLSLNKILDTYKVEPAPHGIVDHVMDNLDGRPQFQERSAENVIQFKPRKIFVGSGFAIAAAIVIFMLFGQFSQPQQIVLKPATLAQANTSSFDDEQVFLSTIIDGIFETVDEDDLYLSSFEELYDMEEIFQNDSEEFNLLVTELLVDEIDDEFESLEEADDIELWDTYFILTANYDL
jgi:hypothetical protein